MEDTIMTELLYNRDEKGLISPKAILADFTYDGILYQISSPTDIDGMKQILADLGITAE